MSLPFEELPLQTIEKILAKKRSRKRSRRVKYNPFLFALKYPNGGPVRQPLPYFYKFLAPQPASFIPQPNGFPGIDANGFPYT